ncbi:MAG: hypothetical protein KGQ79_10735 [Proteobacteria bacterium]|nr:hypothetical protein [Pseudomonadota bacterium]
MRAPAIIRRLKAWRVMRWVTKEAAPDPFFAAEVRRIRRADEIYTRHANEDRAIAAAKREINALVGRLAMAASLGSEQARRRLQQMTFNQIGEYAARTAREALRGVDGKDG